MRAGTPKGPQGQKKADVIGNPVLVMKIAAGNTGKGQPPIMLLPKARSR
jgi:hypothetical protein